jgi:hypothetical protein
MRLGALTLRFNTRNMSRNTVDSLDHTKRPTCVSILSSIVAIIDVAETLAPRWVGMLNSRLPSADIPYVCYDLSIGLPSLLAVESSPLARAHACPSEGTGRI